MPQHSQLVCEYVENISRTALEKYKDLVKEYVARRQGLYALYRKGRLYYVGLASNLRSRLNQHLRDKHGQSWDRFSVYLTIGDKHLREMESMILRIVQPTGNKIKGKFTKATNLRRRLNADIAGRQKSERAELLGPRTVTMGRQSKKTKRATNIKLKGLARYAERSFVIRGTHKGKTIRAKVLRNGLIRVGKRTFPSPSRAASFAIGHGTNGWQFWKYERAPGDWVAIDKLRK